MWPELTHYLESNFKVDLLPSRIGIDILQIFEPGINQEVFLERYLKNIISQETENNSFIRPQVVYIQDILPIELVFLIHHYFQKRCCNSENLVFIVPSHVGLHDWWEQYKELMGIKSIVFIDAPYFSWYSNRFNITTRLEHIQPRYEKHFSAWISGKQAVPIHNQYLLLLLLEHKHHGIIDCYSKLNQKQNILDLAESLTNFCNANLVDKISQIYDANIVDGHYHSNIVFNNNDGSGGVIGDDFLLLEDIKCPINVVRETLCNTPYYCFTEKSIRPFLHQQLVLPVCYLGHKVLSAMGFELPNVINYNYCNIRHFGDRMNAMMLELERLISLPLEFFANYRAENIALYKHNFYNALNTDKTNMQLAIDQFRKKYK